MDLISRRTRTEFQEYLVSTTLRIIEQYFDNHDVARKEIDVSKIPGERRSLVAKYYASVSWEDKVQVGRVLRVYADILFDIENDQNSFDNDYKKRSFEQLTKYLQRDGYHYENGKINRIGQIAAFEDLQGWCLGLCIFLKRLNPVSSFLFLLLFACPKSNQKGPAAAIAPHAQRCRRTGEESFNYSHCLR